MNPLATLKLARSPSNRPSDMQTLLVDGVPIVAEGELITDAAPGPPVRRVTNT